MSKARVCLTRRWPEAAEAELAKRFDLSVNASDYPMDKTSLHASLREFDIVCPTVTDRIDAEVIGAGPVRAKALCNFGAGISHIDLECCRSIGIQVTNTPDVLTADTADLAILLILMCARRAGEGERLVRSGQWHGWSPTHLLGTAVRGRTLGIVGFGRIGHAVAKRARHGLGMDIIYSSRSASTDTRAADLDAVRVPFHDLLARSDVVSLHVPGGTTTYHLVGRNELDRMKRSAILINVSRGEVIDELALAKALGGGRLAAAGLDVYESEPAIAPPLLALENVVLLPHLGSATLETRTAMGLRAMANVEAILAGHRPRDLVS